MRNKTGDIIILHKDTKNHNHMLHNSWDTVVDENVYFSFIYHLLATWCSYWDMAHDGKTDRQTDGKSDI